MAGPTRNSQDSGLPISDINITPFVDVVLVLLVIFMVTAPALLKESIGIQLPKTQTSDGKKSATLAIAINSQGIMLLNGSPVSDEDLKTEVKRLVQSDGNAQAIISADQESKHRDLAHAIDLIKQAGLQKFAIQVERQEK
jgi:biopolymer transport protein ExbD